MAILRRTRCINSYKARRVVEARLTQVVILILNGASQFDMPGDATTDECARETRAHGTRRANYGGGVQAVIATLENLISTLDGAASSAGVSAPCRPIVAPPTTPCDVRAHGRRTNWRLNEFVCDEQLASAASAHRSLKCL